MSTRASDSSKVTRWDGESLRGGTQTHPGIVENGILAMAVPRTNLGGATSERELDFGSGGRGFESLSPRHLSPRHLSPRHLSPRHLRTPPGAPVPVPECGLPQRSPRLLCRRLGGRLANAEALVDTEQAVAPPVGD
jgi:hypothetical protein